MISGMMLIALGGAAGALVRYKTGLYFKPRQKVFPLGTFMINISGAFLLGFLNARNVSGDLRYLLMIGFLGAYTTFSTYMYETLHLLQIRKWGTAASYLVLSVVTGVLLFMAGWGIGRL